MKTLCFIIGFIMMILFSYGSILSEPLNGNYTVGGISPDFATLQDAAHALYVNGVSGPVIFNIRPGTYFRVGDPGPVLRLDSTIAGLSADNRIIFQPDGTEGGNVDNVILAVDCDINTNFGDDREVVHLKSNHTTFRNLTFWDRDSVEAPARWMLRLDPLFPNPAIDDILVDGCKFIGTPYYNQGSNGQYGTVIGIGGNVLSSASIINSDFMNLNQAISLNGSGGSTSFNCAGNNFTNLYVVSNNSGAPVGGAIITANASVFIRNNSISNSTGRSYINVENPATGVIESNYISANYSYGDVFVEGNVTDSLTIKNNIINGGATNGALYVATSNTKIFNNTIMNSLGGNQTLYIGGNNCTMLNNIILDYTNGGISFVSANSAGLNSDHNIFFKTGPQGWFARINGVYYSTFDDYRAGTSLDSNSVYTDVQFVFDSISIHLDECQAQSSDLIGIPLPEVPVDFYGAIRDSVKPFVGAVEGVRLPFDMFGDPYRTGLGGFATSIAQGRFDNSPAPGIAVPDYDNGAVYLYHNNGASRSFNQYATLYPAFPPTLVYFYDLDNDANTDLIIAGEDTQIEVRWGDGAGGFSNPTTLETLGRVRSIHSGQQNIDNLNTILLMEDNGFLPNSSFLCYLDNSNGRNLEHLVVQIPFTNDPDTIYAGVTDFVAGDLDGNGTDEVVAPGVFGSTNVQPEIVVLSDTSLGNYPWAHQNIYPGIPSASYTNSSIALGDFDGDADNDFITNGWDDNYCVLVRNEGNLAFSIDTIPASASRGLVKMDYENDGDLDIVTINNTLDSLGVTVFLNNGTGSFEEKRNCFLPFASGQPFGMVAADFDEDGSTDIAMVSRSFGGLDSLFVLYNLGGFNQTTDMKTSESENQIPEKFELSQNYPNPFNPSTKINLDLPDESNVKIFVYDILGERVKELVNGRESAGEHIINFNASNFASGIYIYQIIAETLSGNTLYTTAKKMILMK